MAITPQAIIDDLQAHLRDVAAATWADSDMVEYMNNALYQILKLRPNAFSVVESKQLVAGTKQTLTAGDYMLLDVYMNMGTDGTTQGKVITHIERWQLDYLLQNWHKGTGKAYTEHYNYDPEKSLTTFFVYPSAKSGTVHYIEMNVARPHTKITTGNQANTIALDVAYEPAIKEWMLREAYLKNTSVASNAKASSHQQTFYGMMSARVAAEQAATNEMKANK